MLDIVKICVERGALQDKIHADRIDDYQWFLSKLRESQESTDELGSGGLTSEHVASLIEKYSDGLHNLLEDRENLTVVLEKLRAEPLSKFDIMHVTCSPVASPV